MDKEDLNKLNKKELIKVIESYKEKLLSLEEYMHAMKPDNMATF